MSDRITDFRGGMLEAMAAASFGEAGDTTSKPVPPAVWAVMVEVMAEIDRARSIHGLSVEHGTDSDRARILLCEAVEANQAVDDVAHAEKMRDAASRTGSTSDLENARGDVAAARREMRAEVVQTAASAMRWLMADRGGQ